MIAHCHAFCVGHHGIHNFNVIMTLLQLLGSVLEYTLSLCLFKLLCLGEFGGTIAHFLFVINKSAFQYLTQCRYMRPCWSTDSITAVEGRCMQITQG